MLDGRSSEVAGFEREGERVVSGQARVALALYAIAGGVALGYEVVWSQAMAQFLSTRVFAFSVVLATYLAGLVVGSSVYVRYLRRWRDAWGLFGLLIAAAGVIALLEVAGLRLWQLQIQIAAGRLPFSATGSEFARMCAQFFVAAVGVVFVPTVLLGAAFPAALRLRSEVPVSGMDDGLRGEVQARRGALMDFYAAGIAAYNGDREQWGEAMQRVRAADGENPYYLGSAGGDRGRWLHIATLRSSLRTSLSDIMVKSKGVRGSNVATRR